MTRQITSAGTAVARESARRSNGEFGTQPLAEADLDSIDLDTSGSTLTDFDWDDHEALNELVDTTYMAARQATRRTGSADRGYSVDDVAQDAFVAILERRAKGKGVDNVHAYVNRAASNAAAKAGRSVRSEDFAAYRTYQTRSQQMSGALGRPLTSGEEQALATQIRDDWHDQRHKPSVDFVQNVRGRERLTDDIVETSMLNGGIAPLHHTDGPTNEVAPGSWLDRGLDAVEGDERNLREARKMLWNAMAERSGAPIIDEAHLGHRAVTHARKSIATDADMEALLDRYDEGRLDADSTKALFAPWGETSPAEREQVAQVLRGAPAYAYGIWDSALRAATKSR